MQSATPQCNAPCLFCSGYHRDFLLHLTILIGSTGQVQVPCSWFGNSVLCACYCWQLFLGFVVCIKLLLRITKLMHRWQLQDWTWSSHSSYRSIKISLKLILLFVLSYRTILIAVCLLLNSCVWVQTRNKFHSPPKYYPFI